MCWPFLSFPSSLFFFFLFIFFRSKFIIRNQRREMMEEAGMTLPSSGFASSYNVHTTYSSHVVTVMGVCPPASAPSCTRSTSVPCMLIDLFFYHYTPINHTDTHISAHPNRETERDGWMVHVNPQKGWKKTVGTLGRQSNTEFFPPGLPPSAPSLRRERGVSFCFSHRNKPQANKQLIAREK